MANHERDAAKERFWRDVLKRQAKSGLSVRAFCQRERLTESAFYAWRRTVAERNARCTKTMRTANRWQERMKRATAAGLIANRTGDWPAGGASRD